MAPLLDRRQFTLGASAWALFAAAHGSALATPSAGEDLAPAEARIRSLLLQTATPLATLEDFYHRILSLPVAKPAPERLTVQAGDSEITFAPAAPGVGEPFYHVAFNIPENKLLAAREWLRPRLPLLPPNAGNLNDPSFPDDVTHFAHWNAHSLFFWDPAGNLLECIARHDLRNAAPGAFTSADLLCASEIGFISDAVPQTAQELQQAFGLAQYRGGSDQFRALGDEHGLVLVIGTGRNWWGKSTRIFPTAAGLRGDRSLRHVVARLPHEIVMR